MSRPNTSVFNKTSTVNIMVEQFNTRPNKKTVQYPHRLPKFSVPHSLREASLDRETLLHHSPVLDQVGTTQTLCSHQEETFSEPWNVSDFSIGFTYNNYKIMYRLKIMSKSIDYLKN